ncbi:MAG: DNA methyltransferase [Candidatus Thermoplasmatota archaeon]|nr:DNA methyltransferase [Candidatus Thermoplasmatota archaeon]
MGSKDGGSVESTTEGDANREIGCNVLEQLRQLTSVDDITELRDRLGAILSSLSDGRNDILSECGETPPLTKSSLIRDIGQIMRSRTIERARYYLDRLIREFTESRKMGISDIDLNRWKEYGDIITDSLWLFKGRDRSGAHNGKYWGNFVPQIPYQLMRRFTKRGEWVLDPFLGSGTTLIECRRQERNGIGVELDQEIARIAVQNIEKEKNTGNVVTAVVKGDSTSIDYAELLGKFGIPSVQLVIMHPPYWDIIRFSNDERDLSNSPSAEHFLSRLSQISRNVAPFLDEGRYLALVIGDKYSGGEWIPLGFMAMNQVLPAGFRLKSIVVKNFDTTRGKMNRKELWRYRALAGGFYVFKHEYVFLFTRKG